MQIKIIDSRSAGGLGVFEQVVNDLCNDLARRNPAATVVKSVRIVPCGEDGEALRAIILYEV